MTRNILVYLKKFCIVASFSLIGVLLNETILLVILIALGLVIICHIDLEKEKIKAVSEIEKEKIIADTSVRIVDRIMESQDLVAENNKEIALATLEQNSKHLPQKNIPQIVNMPLLAHKIAEKVAEKYIDTGTKPPTSKETAGDTTSSTDSLEFPSKVVNK